MNLVWILMVWQVPQAYYMPEIAYSTKAACETAAASRPRGWGHPGNPAPPICMAVPVKS